MGTNTSQYVDDAISIYMVTDKKVYFPGQVVQGEIYVGVWETRRYGKLKLVMIGEEHVRWEEGSDDSKTTYRRDEQTYQSGFVVHDFGHSIDAGQYAFPFTFVLPSMITGSFTYSIGNQIKYTLKAKLTHPNKDRSQFYQIPLNIMQLPRSQIGPESVTNSVQTSCCCCCSCISDGIVTLKIMTNTNYAKNGDILPLKYTIDNSQSSAQITEVSINLQQKLIQTTSEYSRSQLTLRQWTLFSGSPRIGPGMFREFQTQVRIPEDVDHYTAIGRYIGRYFLLGVRVRYGSCDNEAKAVLHIIINSTHPQLVQPQKIPQPKHWHPLTYPRITFPNMLPYIYKPLPTITYVNLPKNPNIIMKPNFGQEIYPKPQLLYHNVGNFYEQGEEYRPYFGDGKEEGLGEGEGEEGEGIRRKLLEEREEV